MPPKTSSPISAGGGSTGGGSGAGSSGGFASRTGLSANVVPPPMNSMRLVIAWTGRTSGCVVRGSGTERLGILGSGVLFISKGWSAKFVKPPNKSVGVSGAAGRMTTGRATGAVAAVKEISETGSTLVAVTAGAPPPRAGVFATLASTLTTLGVETAAGARRAATPPESRGATAGEETALEDATVMKSMRIVNGTLNEVSTTMTTGKFNDR